MTDTKTFYRYYRLFTIPLVFALYIAISYFINPFSSYWNYLLQLPTGRFLLELSLGLLTCWGITEMSIASARWLDRWMPWERRPLSRSIIQTIFCLIGTFILLRVLDLITPLICTNTQDCVYDELGEWQWVVVCSLMAILINAVHTGNYFLKRWKSSMLEATQLQLNAAKFKEIAMQAQLQSLKLQLDPHFLFNNFSTLSALIEEDPALASSFLEKLSKVYRYMITNLNNDVISLQDELNFIAAYSFLIGIRHGENVNIQVNVSPQNQRKSIPPITLQLLIENAIKHNIASTAQPLHISIYDEGDDLVVKNNIQLITHTLPSTKLGLENIKKRYKLLFDRSVTVDNINGEFVVRLQLVNL